MPRSDSKDSKDAKRMRRKRAATTKHIYVVNTPTATTGLKVWCGTPLPQDGHTGVFGAAHATCRECRATRAARLPDLQQRREGRKTRAEFLVWQRAERARVEDQFMRCFTVRRVKP